MLEIGYFSLPVVGLTAAFSGLVLALQSYMGLAELASPDLAEDSTPRVVLSALVQELGPVLAGLMIAGRVGAAMAAEIGTMRVTEQIDALHTLSVNPIAYLVTPRLLAATLMLPLLVMVGNVIGTGAGYLLATSQLGLNSAAYLAITWETFSWYDISIGLTKAATFGFLIALISTYQGYGSAGGARRRPRGNAGRCAVFCSHSGRQLSHHRLVFCFMIRFDQVHKSFGPKAVLQGLDLEIARGESLVLIGRSGTGKSVTLKCFLGLMQPDQGTISVEGASTTQEVRDKTGMLFQGAALFDSLPVWKNVGFRLIEQGAKNVRAKVDALLKQVDLDSSVGDLRPSDLSGGMQKRVGLARAIAGEPEILLFDEPTTGLDPISGAQINALIASLRKERGATSLTITHDLASAREIADRVALLHQGRIVWQGAPSASIPILIPGCASLSME